VVGIRLIDSAHMNLVIFKSEDGGFTWSWTNNIAPPPPYGLVQYPVVAFGQGGLGIVATGGYLWNAPVALRSLDGGGVWRPIPLPGRVSAVAVINATHALATGFISSDSGSSWHHLNMPPFVGSVTAITVINATTWAIATGRVPWVVEYGQIWRTTNAAAT
jgi:hypothetical protein